MEEKKEKRSSFLLILGASLGLILGGLGVLRERTEFDASLETGITATVNGVPIETEAFEQAVGLLAADARNAIGPAERTHVLNRLIEEELLVQRARELGVDQHDRRVRALLVRQMIDSIVADAQPDEPTPDELKDFYNENKNYFARTGRIWVDPLRFAKREGESETDAAERAQQAASALRTGTAVNKVRADLADRSIIPFPQGMLPPAKVREYLGPSPARAAIRLKPGEISDPIRGGSAYYVLRMVDAEPGIHPPLTEVEKEVRTEMQRRAGDIALRSYLDDLRERGDVRISPTDETRD